LSIIANTSSQRELERSFRVSLCELLPVLGYVSAFELVRPGRSTAVSDSPFDHGVHASRGFDTVQLVLTIEDRCSSPLHSNAGAELDSKRRELARVEHGILENSVQAVAADNGADQRAHSVLDVAQLAKRASQLKIELRQLSEEAFATRKSSIPIVRATRR
jgi:hypothetical protein